MGYDSVQFDKVFEDVVRASGRPLSIIGTLSSDEQERVCDVINPALREFWDTGFWPGTFAVEERDDFDADDFYVLKRAAGRTAIGRIEPAECFYTQKPDPGSLAHVLGFVDDRGDRVVCFDTGCPAAPWVRFQLPCPEFTRQAYAADTVYALNGLAYDADSGECYRSLKAGNAGQDLTDADWWEKQLFPALARTFVKWSASSEWMAEDDGKYKQAARARRELEDLEDRWLPALGIGR